MKKFVALLLMLLACACARKPAGQIETAASALSGRWAEMEEAGRKAPSGPYRLQLAMRFGEEGSTRRVTAILWGNGPDRARLDIMAGIGPLVAKIMENEGYFLAYAPREGKAYTHEGESGPLLKIGTPIPFNLRQVAALLNGHFEAVFGKEHGAAAAASGDLAAFALYGKPGGELFLDAAGLPVKWSQSGQGWTLALAYGEAAPLPRQLRLNHPNGKMAVITVKAREAPQKAFDAAQMEIALPETTPLLPLSKFKPS